MQRSVELPPTYYNSERKESETGIWRNQVCVNSGLRTHPEKDIRTIFDLWQICCDRWSPFPCFGTRHVVNSCTVEKTETSGTTKLWTYYELGSYEYRSYSQVWEESQAIGSGLRKLGLQKGDKIAIYAETSYPPRPLLAFTDFAGHSGRLSRMVGPFTVNGRLKVRIVFAGNANCYCVCEFRSRRS